MIKPCKPVHRPQRLSLCLRVVETAPLEGFGSTNAEVVTDDLQLTTPRRPDEPDALQQRLALYAPHPKHRRLCNQLFLNHGNPKLFQERRLSNT